MQDFLGRTVHPRSKVQLPYDDSNMQATGEFEMHLMYHESKDSSSEVSDELELISLPRSPNFFSRLAGITTYHHVPKVPQHRDSGWSTMTLDLHKRVFTIQYSLDIYAPLETTWNVVLDSQWYTWSVIVLPVSSHLSEKARFYRNPIL